MGNQQTAWFDPQLQPQLRTREAFLGTSIVRDDGLRLCFFGTHFPMQRLQSVLVSNKINDSEKLMAAKIECPGDLVGNCPHLSGGFPGPNKMRDEPAGMGSAAAKNIASCFFFYPFFPHRGSPSHGVVWTRYARVLREVLCRAAAWNFSHNTVPDSDVRCLSDARGMMRLLVMMMMIIGILTTFFSNNEIILILRIFPWQVLSIDGCIPAEGPVPFLPWCPLAPQVIFVQGDLNSRTVFDHHEIGSQAKDVLLEVGSHGVLEFLGQGSP